MLEPGAQQQRAQERIAAALGETGFALPGSLVWRTTACGKASCRCQHDPPVLHGPYLTWTRTVNGKTVTRKISEDQHANYQAWFDNARRLHHLVSELEVVQEPEHFGVRGRTDRHVGAQCRPQPFDVGIAREYGPGFERLEVVRAAVRGIDEQLARGVVQTSPPFGG